MNLFFRLGRNPPPIKDTDRDALGKVIAEQHSQPENTTNLAAPAHPPEPDDPCCVSALGDLPRRCRAGTSHESIDRLAGEDMKCRHRRIRLVAYGARLESVLGESPRGFESPILRSDIWECRMQVWSIRLKKRV